MENSVQWILVPDLSHAMVGFLGLFAKNNSATHFVHSFLTCEKRDKKLKVSYQLFNGPVGKAVLAGHGCPLVTQNPPGPGALTELLREKFTLQGTPLSSSLWMSSGSCFQQVHLLFNRPATQSHLPFNKNKVPYTFSTLPLSMCSSTNLCVIISTEACRLFY